MGRGKDMIRNGEGGGYGVSVLCSVSCYIVLRTYI